MGNKIHKHEMERKADFHQNWHVCDVWGRSRCILREVTGAFYQETESELPKIFTAPYPCFQDLQKTGVDAKPLAIGRQI